MYIVELEAGVYLSDGEGDPPRTLDPKFAIGFHTMAEAGEALTMAREFRPFPNATINTA